jgi:lysophospholipase L1-like esterase
MPTSPQKRRAPWLARLGLVVAPFAIAFVAAEMVFRQHVPFCGTTPFRPSPITGLSHELRPSFTTLYKGFDVSMNSAGFRGAEFLPAGAGTKRVAFVGDSVTFGNAVALPDTFPARLEERWKRGGVAAAPLNCGVPGYNIENVALLLEHRVLALRPDVVVYVCVFNDVEVNTQSGSIPQDARIDTLSEYPLRSATLQWLGMRGRALTRSMFGEQASGWVGFVLRSFEQGGRERMRLGLQRIQYLCAQANVRLLVAIYPHSLPLASNPFRVIDDAARLLCGELAIPCVDLANAFAPNEDLTRYWASIFDSHPNGDANAKVAALLERELAERFGVK